jgi:hypothetical protein
MDGTNLVSLLNSLPSRRGKWGSSGSHFGGRPRFRAGSGVGPCKALRHFFRSAPEIGYGKEDCHPMLVFCNGRDDFSTRGVSGFMRDHLKSGQEFILKIYGSAGHELFDPMNQEYNINVTEDSWGSASSGSGHISLRPLFHQNLGHLPVVKCPHSDLQPHRFEYHQRVSSLHFFSFLHRLSECWTSFLGSARLRSNLPRTFSFKESRLLS